MTLAKPPCDEAIIQLRPHAVPCSRRTGTWVLVATVLGSGMAFIDGSVVNVALPVLQSDLRANVADVQWVIEIYTLLLSALILVGGSLGDRYGRRLIFGTGIALFTLASVACGLSQTIPQLIAARAVQGVGGAMLVPGSLAMISATFDEDQRGRALGTWSGFSAITAGAAPLLGGFLIEHLSWRIIFFINVPLAVAVLIVLVRFVPESRNEEASDLDWAGAVLATVGLGALVYGFIQAGIGGLASAQVLGTLFLGVALLIAFVVVEARLPHAMMPLQLFRSGAFAGANILTLLLYGGLGEITFFLPFNLIRVQGYSTTAAGAAFLPFILIMFLLSRWSGGLVARFGPKLPLVVGPLIAGLGMALMAIPDIGGSYWTTFFPAIVLLGLGMAIAIAPLTTVVMGAVEQRSAGIASGINNAASRTAGLLSIAVIGIVVVQIFGSGLSSRLTTMGTPPGLRHTLTAQQSQLTNIHLPRGLGASSAAALQRAINQSFVDGFRVAALVAGAMAALSAVCAALLIESPPSAKQHVDLYREPAAASE